jgi:hypothetical protein
MTRQIDLNGNLGLIQSLLIRDVGFVPVDNLRDVRIEGPIPFTEALEFLREDGSVVFIDANAILGLSLRKPILTADEIAAKQTAIDEYERLRFAYLHYADRAVFETAAAVQKLCAAGPNGRCGGEQIANLATSHMIDGQIYCGGDSSLVTRYGAEFDSAYS